MSFVLKNLAAMVCAVGFIVIGSTLVMAQFEPPRDSTGGQLGPGGPGGGPDAMHAFSLKQIQTSLRANDKEWELIRPKVTKVLRLQRSVQDGRIAPLGLGPMVGPRLETADRPAPAENRPTPPMPDNAGGAEAKALAGKLDSLKSTDEEISVALESLRDSRAKQQEELGKARQELRSTLILRQEARLVVMGILE